jgi:hypothetical protein
VLYAGSDSDRRIVSKGNIFYLLLKAKSFIWAGGLILFFRQYTLFFIPRYYFVFFNNLIKSFGGGLFYIGVKLKFIPDFWYFGQQHRHDRIKYPNFVVFLEM